MNPLSTAARTLDFQGRATRSEYWGYVSIQAVWFAVGWPLSLLTNGGGNGDTSQMVLRIWLAIAILGNVPTTALFIRRLHDVGHRAIGWVLFCWFPLVTLMALVVCMRSGQVGENRFGPDPKGRDLPNDGKSRSSTSRVPPSLDRAMNLDSFS